MVIRQRSFLHINFPGNGCFQHLIRWLSVWFRIWVGRIWVLLLLSAFPIRGRHRGFSVSSCSNLLYPPPSLQHQPCRLSQYTNKPPFWPSRFPLSRQIHPQHPSPNIPIIFSLYMSIPPQYRLPCFLSKPSHRCCPSGVLIPDLVHSCHS